MIFVYCSKEFHPVGVSILNETVFDSNKLETPIYSYQKKTDFFQTDGLPLAQLGEINHPIFGLSKASITSQLAIPISNPVFGDISEQNENQNNDDPSKITENETVTQVYLEIPFFNNLNDRDSDGVIDEFDIDPNDPLSDSDSDGVADYLETQDGSNPLSQDSDNDGILDGDDQDNSGYDVENKVYQIDSIFGNRDASFKLKVYELTYYLSSLDPGSNFESINKFYSNRDFFDEGFSGEILYDSIYSLDFNELRFNFSEDDSSTPDVNEREKVESRLTPRIRVPLNKNFFQTNFLDKEGSQELENQDNFSNHLKGIIIRAEDFSDNLYMLLDISQANIKVEYEYDKYNKNGTEDDTSDDFIEKGNKSIPINLGGFKINTIFNNNYDQEIENQISLSNGGDPASKIYLSGSSGLHCKLNLFSSEKESSIILNDLRNSNWLINEASINLYIDQFNFSLYSDLGIINRLYLYNYDDSNPLNDYVVDETVSQNPDEIQNTKLYYGGILEYDDNGLPYRYKFRITDHIKRIIRNDSTNVELGLVVTSNIDDISYRAAMVSDQIIKYPSAAILNPLGVVLYGSHPEEENNSNKIQLEIFYTEF
ncbi:MAG: DUF4270 domain-containing protein [Flavobacteriaceae bacterium]|nr:DUF4270 domain-containing protein [Flavobacteriaceae bacterium]